MKRIFNIGLIIISILLLINIMLLILINIPAVQSKIVNIATQYVKEKTHSEMSIEHVEIDIFNGITIDKIYVEDLRKDTLIYVNKLNVDVSITNAYSNGKLKLNDVYLSDFFIQINKDSADAPFNFQFLIDAFASEDTTKEDTPSDFDLKIKNISLRNGRIAYDIKDQPETKDSFNTSHIYLSDLNADLSINTIDIEKLAAEINSFTIKEKSGLYVKDINAKVENKNKKISANINIDLAQTHLSLPKIEFDYSATEISDSLLLQKSKAQISVCESKLYLNEAKPFFAQLASLNNELSLDASINYDSKKAEINNLDLKYADALILLASAKTSDLLDYENAEMNVDITKLYSEIPQLSSLLKNFIPDFDSNIIDRLGYADVKLSANGKLNDMDIILDTKSAIGAAEADGKIAYTENEFNAKARINSEKIDLSALLDTTLRLGNIAIDAFVATSIPNNGNPEFTFKGDIPLLQYNRREYNDITIDARLDENKHIDADINISDEDIKIIMTAKGDNIGEENMNLKLKSTLKNISPYAFNLTDENYKSLLISSNIDLSLKGNNIKNIICNLNLDSTAISSDSGKIFIEKVNLKVTDNNKGGQEFAINTPYINAKANGIFNFETISSEILNDLNDYIPTFSPHKEIENKGKPNDFTIDINIANSEEISKILKLPFVITKPSHITGWCRPAITGINLKAEIPQLFVGENELSLTKINIIEKEDAYDIDIQTNLHSNDDAKMAIGLNAIAKNDKVKLHLQYDNDPYKFHLKGVLNNTISFTKYKKDSILITSKFDESDLLVNEFSIKLKPSEIKIMPNLITINGFALATEGKDFLTANGKISNSRNDSMLVDFSDAHIEKILKAANIFDIPLNGRLNGTINLSALMGRPRIFTKGFQINNLTYNGNEIGDAVITSKWSNKLQGMRLSARIENDSKILLTADGNASTVNDNIDMKISMIQFPIDMAGEALKGTLHNVGGHCGADMQIKGKLSAPDLNGYFFIDKAKGTVDLSGVTYSVSDTIKFTESTINANNIKVLDNDNNAMNIRCFISHNKFSDFKYQVTTSLNNLLILDNESMKDSMISGKLNLGGNIRINGDMKKMTVTGSLKNSNKSKVNLILPESATQAHKFENIIYKKKEDSITIALKGKENKNEKPEQNSNSNPININANIKIELNQDTKFNAIISQATGDAITFNGDGHINASYEKNTAKIFGEYIIKDGSLKIRLAQMPAKTFSLKEGSQVTFNGDPMSSSVDIKAGYRTKADLSTLDQSFSSMGLSSTRVPVECLLGIKGNIKKFDIDYNIAFDDGNDDIARIVNSIINTDDLRIKEFAYLIGFGMFFAPNNDNISGQSMLGSVASASISEVLNNALSGILGNKVTIGTDMNSAQEDLSDLEMNLSVSTQLFNDRLILNTNVGYQSGNNASAESNNSSFIGDFEAQYKLTKNGMLRLKAFNHTNNEFHNISPMTQGVGILFVKEAKTISDLFKLKSTSESSAWRRFPNDTKKDSTIAK